MLTQILAHQLLALLVIIFLGYAIGHIKIKEISLGNSACLFVAIAAGALGAHLSPIVANLGIVFFVYAIGLLAGPQFFRLFHRRGIKYAMMGLFTVVVAGIIAILIAKLLHIDTGMAVGAFSGAMTSTPTLAAATDAIERYLPGDAGTVSIGYAITYPFGLIIQILFVQMIANFYKKKIEEERIKETKEKEKFGFKTRKYRLTNVNLVGKKISDLNLHTICHVNLTRFLRGDQIYQCLPDTVFEAGDVILAVGTPSELNKFKVLTGEEVDVEVPTGGKFESRNIFVSGPNVVGKLLRELKLRETFGITVSRIYRGDVAITPAGDSVLEVGDSIRIIGTLENINRFTKVAGSEKRKLDDTNILILSLGMLFGVLLGEIPVQVGTFTFKLGLAGGPLIVALLLSHFGRIGRWPTRVPNATKFFLRDIGLVFFLTGVGVQAGQKITDILHQQNLLGVILLGLAIVIITMTLAFIIVNKIFTIPIASSLGAICGAITSTPSLGILMRSLEDDAPAISYAAVYPVATILLTVFGQILVFAGMLILQ